LQEQVFWEAPACHLPFQASGRPNSPFSPGGRKRSGLAGAGFWGSSCVPSPVSRHQDAQTPPSPLVGERGRGLRGQVFWEAPARHLPFPGIRTPKLPLLLLWEKGVWACRGRFFGKLLRAISRFQASGRPNPLLLLWEKGVWACRGRFFGKLLRAISRFQASGRPNPLLLLWEKGVWACRGRFFENIDRKMTGADRKEKTILEHGRRPLFSINERLR
jgi:hypothetical protein